MRASRRLNSRPDSLQSINSFSASKTLKREFSRTILNRSRISLHFASIPPLNSFQLCGFACLFSFLVLVGKMCPIKGLSSKTTLSKCSSVIDSNCGIRRIAFCTQAMTSIGLPRALLLFMSISCACLSAFILSFR